MLQEFLVTLLSFWTLSDNRNEEIIFSTYFWYSNFNPNRLPSHERPHFEQNINTADLCILTYIRGWICWRRLDSFILRLNFTSEVQEICQFCISFKILRELKVIFCFQGTSQLCSFLWPCRQIWDQNSGLSSHPYCISQPVCERICLMTGALSFLKTEQMFQRETI